MSSTSLDLQSCRLEVASELRRRGLTVLTMGDFPALETAGSESSVHMVARCDVFFGIYARRYGTLTASGESITELEFLKASEQGLARFCFFLADSATWTPSPREDESARSNLERLKARIRTEVTVKEFSSLHDLIAEIGKSADEYLQVERRRHRRRAIGATCLVAMLLCAVTFIVLESLSRPHFEPLKRWTSTLPSALNRLAVDPKMGRLGLGLWDGSVYLVASDQNLQNTRKLGSLGAVVRDLTFIQGTDELAAAGSGGVAAWSIRDRRTWRYSLANPSTEARCMRSNPVSGTLAVGTEEGNLILINREGSEVANYSLDRIVAGASREAFGALDHLVWRSDGDRLALGYRYGAVCMFDLKQGAIRRIEVPDQRFSHVEAMAFSPKGELVISYQKKNEPSGFHVAAIQSNGLVELGRVENLVENIVPINSDDRILTTDWDGSLNLWAVSKPARLVTRSMDSEVIDESADNKTLLGLGWFPNSHTVVIMNSHQIFRFSLEWRTVGQMHDPFDAAAIPW